MHLIVAGSSYPERPYSHVKNLRKFSGREFFKRDHFLKRENEPGS
jgi:hypothetical protein